MDTHEDGHFFMQILLCASNCMFYVGCYLLHCTHNWCAHDRCLELTMYSLILSLMVHQLYTKVILLTSLELFLIYTSEKRIRPVQLNAYGPDSDLYQCT